MSSLTNPLTNRGARWDDGVLAVLMIVLGGLRVALAVALDERFGGETTIAAIVLALGILLLVTTAKRR